MIILARFHPCTMLYRKERNEWPKSFVVQKVWIFLRYISLIPGNKKPFTRFESELKNFNFFVPLWPKFFKSTLVTLLGYCTRTTQAVQGQSCCNIFILKKIKIGKRIQKRSLQHVCFWIAFGSFFCIYLLLKVEFPIAIPLRAIAWNCAELHATFLLLRAF